jgi:hypothetical protein
MLERFQSTPKNGITGQVIHMQAKLIIKETRSQCITDVCNALCFNKKLGVHVSLMCVMLYASILEQYLKEK